MVKVYRVLLLFLFLTIGSEVFNIYQLQKESSTIINLSRSNGVLVRNSCRSTNILTAILPLVEATSAAQYQAAQMTLRQESEARSC